MKRLLLCATLTGLSLAAAENDSPTGHRTTPAIVNVVTPRGVARGTTVEITVEGLNLGGAKAIYFSEKGIKGRIMRVKELPDLPEVRLGSNGTASTIDLGSLPPRNQVTVELDISSEAPIGPVNFRLQNDLGTSPTGTFLIEPYYGETSDAEPNDTPETATEVILPSILVGTISKPGDTDLYKVRIKAGEELVFENGAAMLGSTLQPVVTLLSEDQTVLKEYGTDGGTGTAYFQHKFEKAGTYYLRVSDYQQSGRATHIYRLKIGKFSLATSAYPLGLQRGQSRSVALKGYNVGTAGLAVKGEASPFDPDTAIVRPKGTVGASFYEVKLALGDEPEVDASGTNLSMTAAQSIKLPVTINARIPAPAKGHPVEHYYRFAARKGQPVVLEVNARRLGSELDSLIEVLDLQGKPVERAVARPLAETFTVLRDHDSVSKGIRLQSDAGWAVGDYALIGGEILRVDAMPRGPDDDFQFEGFMGQRIAFFGTSSEAHAIDKSVYKVQMLPAGAKPVSNGLPVARLYYRNDDGGPGYGKDSYVVFTPPADGDYLVRLADVRGLGGDEYAYRLTVRPPKPDFRLSLSNRNPNVPVGGSIPLNVTALRLDGFDGPIELTVPNLPPGFSATKAVVPPGQFNATILLSAAPSAQLDQAAPWKVVGTARAENNTLTREANPEDKLKLLALMPAADLTMTALTREVTVEAGGTAEVKVRVKRTGDYSGRVPVEVRNLPPTVRVLDVGLNGVLINETENERSFTLAALPTATPLEQVIYVSGLVETRSPQSSSYAAPEAILLKVKPASGQVQVSSTPAKASGAGK